jgi:hypothetical protein
MSTFRCFCSRVSVRRVICVSQTLWGCASHSEAATEILLRKERTR